MHVLGMVFNVVNDHRVSFQAVTIFWIGGLAVWGGEISWLIGSGVVLDAELVGLEDSTAPYVKSRPALLMSSDSRRNAIKKI